MGVEIFPSPNLAITMGARPDGVVDSLLMCNPVGNAAKACIFRVGAASYSDIVQSVASVAWHGVSARQTMGLRRGRSLLKA